LPASADAAKIPCIGMFHEREGVTLIVNEQVARREGLDVRFRAAWITLEAETNLTAVGITAAVSRTLAAANIPCNIVAAVHHDHIFVPVDRANEAAALLNAI
jgi:hypothetical protein